MWVFFFFSSNVFQRWNYLYKMMEIQLKKAVLVLLYLLHNRKGETQERMVAGPESPREEPGWTLSLHGVRQALLHSYQVFKQILSFQILLKGKGSQKPPRSKCRAHQQFPPPSRWITAISGRGRGWGSVGHWREWQEGRGESRNTKKPHTQPQTPGIHCLRLQPDSDDLAANARGAGLPWWLRR